MYKVPTSKWIIHAQKEKLCKWKFTPLNLNLILSLFNDSKMLVSLLVKALCFFVEPENSRGYENNLQKIE